jgi:hypothetical protein
LFGFLRYWTWYKNLLDGIQGLDLVWSFLLVLDN